MQQMMPAPTPLPAYDQMAQMQQMPMQPAMAVGPAYYEQAQPEMAMGYAQPQMAAYPQNVAFNQGLYNQLQANYAELEQTDLDLDSASTDATL